MNTKRLFFAIIASFVFIFFFEFLWHANLMKTSYMEVPILWRPEADFNSHFPLLVLGQAMVAFFLTMTYAWFVSPRGVAAGVGLGLMVALISIGGELITFAVQPLTARILGLWIVGGLIEFAIAGAIIGAIYKPARSAA
jgi:hypothetical protein